VSGPAARLEGVLKRFGERAALDVDSLEFEAGRTHVLVGPNGAGKTTLLRILCGLDAPDAGEVNVLGSSLARSRGAEGLALRRRIGFAAQKPYLFRMTVRGNVEYPLAARGVPPLERRSRGEGALERLGVAHLAERRSRALSAGETERVAIARAIVSGPELLLLDEPLANVDPEGAPVVEKVILDLASAGATVIVATHVLDQAYHLSANVVRLEAGRMAPPAVENLLEGELVAAEAGAVLVLEGGSRIDVVTGKRGRARASIDPGDIVLSGRELDSSARNSLRGRVTALREQGGVVMVTADAGTPITASVTPESCTRLGLTVGSEVVLTFKATAVRVF